MTVERLGIVDAIQERAVLFAGRHPSLARRIKGLPPVFDSWKPPVRAAIVIPATVPLPPKPCGRPTVALVIEAVCDAFQVKRDGILGPCRVDRLARPRMACYRLIYELCTTERGAPSMPWVGRQFKRDHTTVLSGLRRTAILLESCPDFQDRYRAARAVLVPA